MTSKLKIGLFAAGAAALTAGGAVALNARSGEMRGPMAKFDSDSNGSITLAEARTGVATMFAGADANKDGRATHEEMMAFHGRMGDHHRGGDRDGRKGDHPGKVGKGPMHLDADGDGALTLAEAQSGIDAHFARIDSNRDGSIDQAEMRAAHEAHRGAR